MIIDFVITFITSIVIWLLNLLPIADSTVTSNITNYFNSFKVWLGSANNMFPVDHLFIVITAMILIKNSLYLWKVFSYIGGIISGGIIKK